MDDLYSFNVPIYMPCEEEVKTVIQKEGSFNLDKLHVFPVRWDAQDNIISYENDLVFDKYRSGKLVANSVRAFMEPMLVAHFGSSIVDELFRRYAEKMVEHCPKRNIHHITLLSFPYLGNQSNVTYCCQKMI
ncbi:UNVERIFIED_CONTAM: Benzoate carboxyl methyltransferase [Sesamum latifolium]|uniref:Benzoate carboxyl methyltransferase n=1 Tax=Sesamum latifolium TaxID=2727402 RepID=A0AAW2U600_9LAMI